MMGESNFRGFGLDCFQFFEALAENNERQWFNEHKPRFQERVMEPAKAFVREFGMRLRSLSDGLIADDRSNGAGSIFRIYRDTRFSKDKTPYKTHLGILFWEGPHKKMTSPGYYLHLDKDGVTVHGGMYVFTKPQLATYRQAVSQEPSASEIVGVLQELESKGYRVGGKHYKRVPTGFEKDHENAELLKHNGLYAHAPTMNAARASESGFMDRCFQQCEVMIELHRWLSALQAISPCN